MATFQKVNWQSDIQALVVTSGTPITMEWMLSKAAACSDNSEEGREALNEIYTDGVNEKTLAEWCGV